MTCMRAHKSFNFGLIGPPTVELAALERRKKISIGLLWEKPCLLFFFTVLDWILFILAGNDNIHDSLEEFEIKSNLIRDTELAALEQLKKFMLPLFLISQLWLYLGNSQVSVYRTIGPLVWYHPKIQTRVSFVSFYRGIYQSGAD